eukprot:2394469-Pleurochrysis_carterae.AAC.1
MSDLKLSLERARRPTDYESHDEKMTRLAKRAKYDKYARYRAGALPPGVTLAKHARDDEYS